MGQTAVLALRPMAKRILNLGTVVLRSGKVRAPFVS